MVITNGLTKKGVERLGPRSGKLIAFAVPSVYVKVCELQKILFSFHSQPTLQEFNTGNRCRAHFFLRYNSLIVRYTALSQRCNSVPCRALGPPLVGLRPTARGPAGPLAHPAPASVPQGLWRTRRPRHFHIFLFTSSEDLTAKDMDRK